MITLRPFVPAWFDELGLSAAEFRVLMHLWRWARTKNGVKPCTSTARTIQRTCRLSEPTVWKCLRSLEVRGLLQRSKRFQESNVYHVKMPSPITQKETVIESLKPAGQLIPKKRRRLIPKTTMRRGDEKEGMRIKGGEALTCLPQALSEAETESAAQALRLTNTNVNELYEGYRAIKGRFLNADHPKGVARSQVLTVFLAFLRADSRGKNLLAAIRPTPVRDYSSI